jgi:hypothetical protein
MPEQTVKHNYNASGFLLILIPLAFFAVFVSVAWPLIIGATLLFTGNNLWQSYQLAKISQQVNPLFNQLIIEKNGTITPLELSVRANIPGKVAHRYLDGKAVEFGGTSQGLVYNFLTVNSLENVFTGINPNPTAQQKLAELEAPASTQVQSSPKSITLPVSKPLPATTPVPPIAKTQPPTQTEVVAAQLVETTTVGIVPETSAEAATETVIESADPETTVDLTPEPKDSGITETPVKSVIETPPEPVKIVPVSSFGQALRTAFNAEHAEENQEVVTQPESSSAAEPELISQADLAKRLDVHASTIYKRRSDVSFGEWTRNRDPEGLAWAYSRESKEFYRLG